MVTTPNRVAGSRKLHAWSPSAAIDTCASRAKRASRLEVAVRAFDEIAPAPRRAEIMHFDPRNIVEVVQRLRPVESRAERNVVGLRNVGENFAIHASIWRRKRPYRSSEVLLEIARAAFD